MWVQTLPDHLPEISVRFAPQEPQKRRPITRGPACAMAAFHIRYFVTEPAHIFTHDVEAEEDKLES